MPVLRPWSDARDPWRWLDHDLESDPTVFVPYLVRLQLREPGATVRVPALWASIDDRGASVHPARESAPIHWADVGSGRVDIRPVPADWQQSRARYPWAYEPWDGHEAVELYQWALTGLSTEDIAQRLARPPEHIMIKLARVRALVEAAGTVPPRVESAPYGRYEPSKIIDHVATEREQVDPLQRPWYDEDPEPDPTAHVRLVLHLRQRGTETAMTEPVLSVGLRERVVRYQSARDRGRGQMQLTDVASGHVEIRRLPADHERLRATYTAAYDVWRPEDALRVLHWGRRRAEQPVEWLVQRLNRPPEHLAVKYERLEALARAARTPGPRAEPAPHHRCEPRVEGEYGVAVLDVAVPREVAARVGAHSATVLDGWFFAKLSDEQLAGLRADPDVDHIEDSAIGTFG